jgi:hypothetical protein
VAERRQKIANHKIEFGWPEQQRVRLNKRSQVSKIVLKISLGYGSDKSPQIQGQKQPT